MSDSAPATPTSTDVATTAQVNASPVGLEDFDQDDIVMPRIKIVADEHRVAYQDSLSKEENSSFEAVVLGLVKGRVLWPAAMGETTGPPMCRSYDHDNGIVDPDKPEDFPWDAAGFSRAEYTVDNLVAPLKCADCKLSEWETHPTREKISWCADQYNLLLLLPVDGEYIAPALMTFQRSSIPAIKAYMSGFMRTNKPSFTVTTKFALRAKSRGTVYYAEPIIARGEDTDVTYHDLWTDQYLSTRDMMQTARVADEEDDKREETTTTVVVDVAAPAAATMTDDEIPF